METVKEKARDYAIHEYWGVCEIVDCDGMIDKSEEDFKAGVEFAQRWIPIERDKDGLTTKEQDDDFLNNVPFLAKSEYGIELFEGLNTELEKKEFTHWRPVNIK